MSNKSGPSKQGFEKNKQETEFLVLNMIKTHSLDDKKQVEVFKWT